MDRLRFRSAVSPLRRGFDAAPTVLPRVDDLIAVSRPEEPTHCLRPDVFAATARAFVAAFPGDVLYAVKCNPEPAVLRALWAWRAAFRLRVTAEVSLVRSMFPDGEIHFMHPMRRAARSVRRGRGTACATSRSTARTN